MEKAFLKAGQRILVRRYYADPEQPYYLEFNVVEVVGTYARLSSKECIGEWYDTESLEVIEVLPPVPLTVCARPSAPICPLPGNGECRRDRCGWFSAAAEVCGVSCLGSDRDES